MTQPQQNQPTTLVLYANEENEGRDDLSQYETNALSYANEQGGDTTPLSYESEGTGDHHRVSQYETSASSHQNEQSGNQREMSASNKMPAHAAGVLSRIYSWPGLTCWHVRIEYQDDGDMVHKHALVDEENIPIQVHIITAEQAVEIRGLHLHQLFNITN